MDRSKKSLVSCVLLMRNADADSTVRTVQSVLNQDFPLELIVWDNGSEEGDSYDRVLQQYGRNGSISVMEGTRRNYSDALNTASGYVKGEYIFWLNPGDFLVPGFFDALAYQNAFRSEVIRVKTGFQATAPEDGSLNFADAHKSMAADLGFSSLLNSVSEYDFCRRDSKNTKLFDSEFDFLGVNTALFYRLGFNNLLNLVPEYDFWLRASEEVEVGEFESVGSIKIRRWKQSELRLASGEVCIANKGAKLRADTLQRLKR